MMRTEQRWKEGWRNYRDGSYVDANIPNVRDYNFNAYTNSIDVASSKQDSSPDTSWRPTRFASEEGHLQERSTWTILHTSIQYETNVYLQT